MNQQGSSVRAALSLAGFAAVAAGCPPATASPSPTPSLTPPAPATATSLGVVSQLRAGGPPGDSETFEQLVGFTRRFAPSGPQTVAKQGSKYAAVTFAHGHEVIFVVPVDDVRAAITPGATPPPAAGGPPGFGFTLPRLLAAFHRDRRFAGKTIVRAADGTLLMAELTETDPNYDHGFKATTFTYYFFRRGVVAATEFVYTEN